MEAELEKDKREITFRLMRLIESIDGIQEYTHLSGVVRPYFSVLAEITPETLDSAHGVHQVAARFGKHLAELYDAGSPLKHISATAEPYAKAIDKLSEFGNRLQKLGGLLDGGGSRRWPP